MLNEKQQAALDQGTAMLADNYPPMWKRIYDRCVVVGFTESESFKLLQTFILSQCPAGVRGDDGQ